MVWEKELTVEIDGISQSDLLIPLSDLGTIDLTPH